MKILLMAICFIALGQPSAAQNFKNRTLHAVDFFYLSREDKYESISQTYRQSSAGATISSGYFVSQKLVLGISAGYGQQNRKNAYTNSVVERIKEPQIRLGLYGGVFQPIAASRFYYSPRISAHYSHGNGRRVVTEPGMPEVVTRHNRRGVELYIQPLQFSYLVSKSIVLGTGISSLSFESTKTTSKSGNSSDNSTSKTFGISGSAFLSSFSISYLW